jgi:hypothetical protein
MIRLIAGMCVAAALCAAADKDMQRAIAWERFKDQAAARQAAKERRHPSVSYNSTANRASEDVQGTPVKDPGAKEYRDAQKSKK